MSVESTTIYLLDVATNAAVQAELRDGVVQQNVDDWHDVWLPELTSALKSLLERGVPRHQLPQDRHWNWHAKLTSVQGLLAHRSFCVVANSMTQGFMRVDLTKTASLPGQTGKPLVYVDFLETAPWNRPELVKTPRLRGVGKALVAGAIALSLEEGFHGRIGLHSLPQADDFYRKKCRMDDLGADSTHQSLRYFEMTAEVAQAILGKEGS